MGFIKELTPDRTEEVKPGLFIQQTRSGEYRKVEPIVWGGKIRWKQQIKSVFSFRFIMTIGIVLLLVYSYNHDNSRLVDFYNDVSNDTEDFCRRWQESQIHLPCTPEQHAVGDCWMNGSEFGNINLDATWNN